MSGWLMAAIGGLALAAAIAIWRLPRLSAFLGGFDLLASLGLFVLAGGFFGAALAWGLLP